MKKFILTIGSYFLILAILICSINYLYILNDTEDTLNVKRFESIPDTIRFCNLGSSHGQHSFNYSGIPDVATFSFAFTAQSLSYDYRLLTHYQNHLTDGSIVFIPLSYFSFFGYDETELDDFASKNKRYYHILPRELIKNYDWLTYLCTVPFPAVGAGTNMISVFLRNDTPAAEEDSIRTADMIDIEANARSAYERHLHQNRRDKDGNLILQEGEIQAVYDIITLCESRNAIPILVTTPYLREYTDQVLQNAPEFLPYFYSIVNRISEDTGVPYLDYAFDARFLDDYSLFMDSDHLNTAGSELFTGILLEDIQQYTA